MNRRVVRGKAARPQAPVQPQLVPLAEGHAVTVLPTTPTTPAPAPFSEAAPEAQFSLAALCEPASTAAGTDAAATIEQPLRSVAPPSFREIRAGRAAAAARAPIAEVRIPIEQIESPQLQLPTSPDDGLDELVERVRRRTAARLARTR